MSHKTQYKTFTNPDLTVLENEVNEYIKSLHKNENHESVKINNLTTLTAKDVFVVALTYSYSKKKKPQLEQPVVPA